MRFIRTKWQRLSPRWGEGSWTVSMPIELERLSCAKGQCRVLVKIQIVNVKNWILIDQLVTFILCLKEKKYVSTGWKFNYLLLLLLLILSLDVQIGSRTRNFRCFWLCQRQAGTSFWVFRTVFWLLTLFASFSRLYPRGHALNVHKRCVGMFPTRPLNGEWGALIGWISLD